jgi:putative NADPH-quinone reductase
VTVILGHPDPHPARFGRVLAAACLRGAREGGHQTRFVDVALIDFPVLRTQSDWKSGNLPPGLRDAQEAIGWADHLVILFPLWMGSMPALLRAFIEQVFRPEFAQGKEGDVFARRLAGRSARIVITMGMPVLAYRWYFGAHGLKSLERSILRLCGIGPIRETLIGRVDTLDETGRAAWIERIEEVGRNAR